jgi:two-component system LytT family response regulator
VVRRKGSARLYDVDAADWIEAVQNYVRVHAGTASWLVRQQIGPLETLLDPDRFFRIHRSYVVNLERVQEVVHSRESGWSVVLTSGVTLPCGRSYRGRLEELLSGFR